MIKRFAIVYILVALVAALITTIMQVQPALFFIELLVDDRGKFPMTFTFLLTVFVLLLPLLLMMVIIRLTTKQTPLPDLTGKTGVLVRRERLLANGFYTDNIMVNGEKKATVSNGKTAFVELEPGSYKLFVKGATTATPVMDIALTSGQRVKLKTGYRPDGLKTSQFLETDLA